MKVVFTGGGTGGHFYPIIAVAQELNQIIDNENIANARLYYFSDVPYDKEALLQERLEFISIPAGKMRLYFSLKNFFDIFKIISGIFTAIWNLYKIYPDIVFGKGGYASFPTLFAARILRIPIMIHESDMVPGRVNQRAGKWAERIALSYAESAKYFPSGRTAHTGQPIRRELLKPIREGAFEYLKLEQNLPILVIFGGSQGANIINDTILAILPEIVQKYQVIHQVGKNNLDDSIKFANAILPSNELRNRYKPFAFLNALAQSMSAGVADIMVTRAGSALFEIAGWGVPSIVIPITNTNGDHQRKNAYAYAGTGACTVIEESNLTPHVLLSEINRIVDNPEISNTMRTSALSFSRPDSAKIIAGEIVRIAIGHEE